jgi:putative ABC transport system permease protein
LKVLARRKFFTFISLFGISMTLVVLMIATAVLDNFYAPRTPESKFDRVLCLYRVVLHGPDSTESSEPGYAFLDRFMRPLQNVEATAIFTNSLPTAVYRGETRIDTDLKRTDAAFWRVCDFHFLEGRPFTADEDMAGAHVAVITDEIREKLFDGAPAAGRTFTFEGETFRVIGVVPRVSITRVAAVADIWMPIASLKSSEYRHSMMGGFNGLVLAHRAADLPRLKAEFQSSLRSYPLDGKEYTEVHAGLDTPFEATARELPWTRSGSNAALLLAVILALAGGLFITLPVLNLVTLNLSRIMERAPEIGVRKAFGAPRLTLVWQFVVENVVLTLIGGLAGFGLAVLALHVINTANLFPSAVFEVNFRIFGYGMLIAVFFGVVSGVYPAWRMSRLDPVLALRGGAA